MRGPGVKALSASLVRPHAGARGRARAGYSGREDPTVRQGLRVRGGGGGGGDGPPSFHIHRIPLQLLSATSAGMRLNNRKPMNNRKLM